MSASKIQFTFLRVIAAASASSASCWPRSGRNPYENPRKSSSPQGAVASPLLANVYLHYVFDLWADRWRHHHAHGSVIFVRYADDVRHITWR